MDGKTVVRTDKAPAPFQGAPYSQAIKAGQTEVVGPGIKAQTEQTIDNLEAILTEAGSSLDRIVKTTVFLASLSDFQGMNEVYAGRIGDTPPARSTIEVGALPSGALVEIEAIALA